MKLKAVLLILLLATSGGPFAALASPSAADVAQASALAAKIVNPSVRAAWQCRVAFAETSASVPVKKRGDTARAGLFWSTYLKKLNGIEVTTCPGEFRTVFAKHVRTVKSVVDSLINPAARPSSAPPPVSHAASYAGVAIPDPASSASQNNQRYNTVPEAGKSYEAVFAEANKTMQTTSAGDQQLAGRIDGLLKD